jgi:hypothetical protein
MREVKGHYTCAAYVQATYPKTVGVLLGGFLEIGPQPAA